MLLTTQSQKDGVVLESWGVAQPSCIRGGSFCVSLLGQKGHYINILTSWQFRGNMKPFSCSLTLSDLSILSVLLPLDNKSKSFKTC